MRPTEALSRTRLFNIPPAADSRSHSEISYLRAEAISKAYDLRAEDIESLSSKFWDMQIDPIVCIDPAALTLLTIQFNLNLGTIIMYTKDRSDLTELVQDLLMYKTLGQFCLTEVGHGLDAYNIETTATLLPDGRFDLHTPNDKAAKFMPPTVPVLGRRCVAVVFARLFVEDEHRGIRPFLVWLNDGKKMYEGISARLLPPRHGYNSVNHSITWFNHVKLPSTALLGDLSKPKAEHEHFLSIIWRVSVGTLALSFAPIAMLGTACQIAYRYSCRRSVHNSDGTLTPIITFRTQQIPIITALAQAYVLEAFRKRAIDMFKDSKLDWHVRHAVATCFKAVILQCSQASHIELSDRCGAQGLFDHNQVIHQLSMMRGIAIAEGDTLVLSIRLSSELLLGRYTMPFSSNPDGLLSRHEIGIIDECRTVVARTGHRSAEFASHVLPRAKDIVYSIGHRMAYDAAVNAAVPLALLDVYLCHVVNQDLAWYVEKGLTTRAKIMDRMAAALDLVFPFIGEWIENLDAGAYSKAPIVSDEGWDRFVQGLDYYASDSSGRRVAQSLL